MKTKGGSKGRRRRHRKGRKGGHKTSPHATPRVPWGPPCRIFLGMTTHLEHLGYPLKACTPPHGPIQLALGVRLASHYPIQVEKLEVCAHARTAELLLTYPLFCTTAHGSPQGQGPTLGLRPCRFHNGWQHKVRQACPRSDS